jgi:apolipoprotein D and lipocalin family protein
MTGRNGWLAIGGLLLGSIAARGQVTAVPQLDLTRFSGSWYKVAMLPDKKEKDCATDSVVLITRSDKPSKFQIVDSCNTKDDTGEAWNETGKPEDKTGDGKLKVGTIWPFYTKYCVIEVSPDYTWALIGTTNHKKLWVLSRKTTLDGASLAEAKAKAQSEGFAIPKMVVMKQGQ